MFFVIDGPDGCGKTTLINRLKESLGGHFVFVSDPGSTEYGKRIREVLKDKDVPMCRQAQILAFTSARSQMVDEVIIPSLSAGRHVICDRYMCSTYVYQGIGVEDIVNLNDKYCGRIVPDVNFILDVSYERMIDRMKMRGTSGNDRFEDDERLKGIHAMYMGGIPDGVFGRIIHVNADKTADEVFHDVLMMIKSMIMGM